MTGEIRRVPNVVERVNEAKKLGFKRVFVPKHVAEQLADIEGIQIIATKTLSEALKTALG